MFHVNELKGKGKLKFLLIICFSIFISAASIFALNMSTNGFSYPIVRQMFLLSPMSHLFSLGVLSVLFVLITLVFNNLLYSSALYISFTFFLTVANTMKMNVLNEPVFPSDVSFLVTIPQLLEMIGKKEVVFIISSFIGLALFVLFVIVASSKWPFFRVVEAKKTRRYIFVTSLLILIVLTKVLTSFNVEGSMLGKFNEKFSLYDDIETVHQLKNYNKFGFVNGLIINAPGENLKKPDNYGKVEIQRIIDKYQDIADEVNSNRSRTSFEDIDLITILSESLSDPSELIGLDVDSPFSYITDSNDKYASGNLISPIYGGGTPNTEYELISSFSMGSLGRMVFTPFQSFLSSKPNVPSLFKSNKETPRTSLAIHSYGPHLYKRQQVYKTLGVDQSIFERNMFNTDPVSESAEFVSDKSSYREVIELLTQSEEAKNIHLVTMQNHSSYNDVYSDYDFDPISDLIDDEENFNQIKYYMQGLYETDKETEIFIRELEETGRPYIVFLYGDHLPTIFKSILPENERIHSYVTKYFFKTNLPTYDIDIDIPEYLSLTNVQNIMMDIADVKISAFQALVLEVNKEFKSIHREGYFLHGTNNIHSYEDLNTYQKELLNDYNNIQYDLISGSSYSKDSIYFQKTD